MDDQPAKNLLLLALIPIIIFFSPVFLAGKMPIPADTIVGLYHPFRDVVWKGMTAGVPFKNFLITDAVRQQYPWRRLAVDLVKSGELPGWNPYTHAGTPLIANPQTAFYYPLNILFFSLPFDSAWTIQVISQPVLLAIFLFAYLRNQRFSAKSSALAALTLTLSGFSVAWLEWNTTLHTLVWVPLALLAVDKILENGSFRWYLTLGFSLVSIIFAGFLQTAFYALLLIFAYMLVGVISKKGGGKIGKPLISIAITGLVVILVTAVQWVPTARLIAESARATDQGDVLAREDWFIPWQHLIQFIAPDFFGNPTTLNYWGIFNYTEFVGYIGIAPLVLAGVGLLTSHDKRRGIKKFFLAVLALSLLLATPNPVARLPFLLNIPLLSTAQPSRLLMLVDFSLMIFVALGADSVFHALESLDGKSRKSVRIFMKFAFIVVALGLVLLGLWATTLFPTHIWKSAATEDISVSQRNLILPTAIVILMSIPITASLLLRRMKFERKSIIEDSLFLILFFLTAGDLLRFASKFTPFSDPEFLYPQTKTLEFLQSDKTVWRYMTTDRRIFPPNFSLPYKLQTIEGYDPLYLSRYGTLIAAAQRGEPSLAPVAFHRIIRPDNYESSTYDLLNVKYVLALSELDLPKLEKVFQEGETRIYRNREVFPRAFLISDYTPSTSDLEAMKQVFNLRKEEIQQTPTITRYSENEVQISVDSLTGGMLVLADTFYPGWSATLDGNPVSVERVLYALRGTMIPPGSHEILYRYTQL